MSSALPLEEQVIAALRRITRAIDLHSRLLLQKNGLTIPQLAALQATQRLQPINVGALARDIHLGPATVTGILGRLEKRGLVSRTRGDLDRRSVVVQLTDEGAKLVAEAPSLLQDRFHRELAKLQEWEQTMILATLQRIASMMDAEDIEAAPVLVPGVVSAVPEDVSRYLEKAVVPTDETPLAEEELGTIEEDLQEDPRNGNSH
ncbi:MAG: MarR family winged helix-turn-helix transcriptional regulator [Planctomycetota bacterium]|jgi:DNA-binding MarR family transcriptional regulator